MQTTLQANGHTRDPYYDNLRAFLILCVVTGHLLETILSLSLSAQILYKWIYSFHMPAFLFVSGIFSKSVYRDGHLKKERLIDFFLIYVVFEVVFAFFEGVVLGHQVHLSFFSPRTGLWYLLAMMMYMLLIPLFDHLHPAVPLVLFLAAGLLVGLDKDADTYMSFSRFCTMGLFFWVGYLCDAKKVRKLRDRKFAPWVGAGILVLSGVLFFFFSKKVPVALLTGKTAYALMKMSWWKGMAERVIWYLLAFGMIFALLCVTPRKRYFYSVVGSRTLQIYLFQALVYMTAKQFHFFEQIPARPLVQAAAAVAAGLLVTTVLSLRVFRYPLDGLNKLAVWLNRILLYPRQHTSEPQTK